MFGGLGPSWLLQKLGNTAPIVITQRSFPNLPSMTHPSPTTALSAQEKKIRRRVQCKMNMRCYRERRKRNVSNLEDAIATLHAQIDALAAQKRALEVHRPLSFYAEHSAPMALTMQYKNMMSQGGFGPTQEAFFRSTFSPDFMAHGRTLDNFISMWYRVGQFFAQPNPLLAMAPVRANIVRFEVSLHVEITRPLLEACFGYILGHEDEATIDVLAGGGYAMDTIMERIFYFDQLEDGRYVIAGSSCGDNRAAVMASLVAHARETARAKAPGVLSITHLLHVS
ncbi:hypothetical protein SPRG_15830 [Saprolegnia parasitica CBS 223.65]|uniref:BZIP domain-containing protein n=1 Tax=Saprolegnia parasitica (strain CBS 223.65) TaxID=695850 RepID=A0A067BL07_SAPPC|nr:hypothetical protein SPRG_15830 [Saprolegnia parasitica CBS 223.65]KDO18878.1 hypothetical protein SPRG_15830 [Saprolegnia parasitica CBS 223.65]|eukprot:XP_012210399.1 hypothetical protein SPRG_15830 [Saprolegnia parasitica CBS 223.65]